MAMTAAGFTGGQAEELRRAMGFKRSQERMNDDRDRAARRHGQERHRRRRAGRDRPGDQVVRALRLPRIARGLVRAARLRVGVPEGAPPRRVHRARCSTPGRWASITRRRWSTTPSATASRCGRSTSRAPGWRCDVEDGGRALRLGLRYVAGLREETGRRIEAARAAAPLASLADFAARAQANERELATLAEVGALAALGGTRRQALWQVDALGRVGRAVRAGSPHAQRRRRRAAARDDRRRGDGGRLPRRQHLDRAAPDLVRARRARPRGVTRAADLRARPRRPARRASPAS